MVRMATMKKDNKKDIDKKDVSTKKKVSTKRRINNKKIVDKEIKKDTKKISVVDRIKKIFKNKKKSKKKEVYNVREVITIMLFSLGIGFIICFGCLSLFIGKNYFSVVHDLKKVVDTYYAIVDNYYGDLDKNKLIDSAVEGMIDSVGDVFTSYSDADSTESFDETINGSYEGIGCTVATYSDGSIVVIDIFEGSPSDKAGLKINDKIIKVDNESYLDKTGNELANYIKNSGKSSVNVTVVREDTEIDITINLEKVEIPYVTGKIMEKDNKKIGYMSISLFSDTSYDQFKNKLEELEDDGIDGLIIDVRDNNGGYLTSVTDICSLFLEKGEIIYQLEDSNGVEKKKDKTKENREYEVVVLINGGSASASEILASAIKESYGGYVVGTTSYGKGTVQQTKKLLDGSMIKYTTQKWLTPQGNCIDGVGVAPTNYVELSVDYFTNPSIDTDNQINEALNLFIK